MPNCTLGRTLLLTLASSLALASCDKVDRVPQGSSVTVKLPPARPADARPGFSSLTNTSRPEQEPPSQL